MAPIDPSEPTSRILLIDHLPSNLIAMKALLGDLPGVEAIGFSGPIEALIWCEGNMPDLILLDADLPVMGGVEMLARLKALPSVAEAPVILLASAEDRESRLAVLAAGASDFIAKPIDSTEFVVRCRNMLSLGKATSLLRRLATSDELTGLSNRRYFLTRLGVETDRANRFPGRRLSVAMIDIDNFKQINDQQGHVAGDAVLRQVARIAADSVRTIDVVGRIGGEEFAIVLPDTDLGGAATLCERLRQRIEDHPFHVGGDPVTISGGLAEFTTGERFEKLLARADERLRDAKQQGKNRIAQ